MDIWPQDEYRFYDPPVSLSVVSTGLTIQPLIPVDLNRRVLILSGDSVNSCRVGPTPNFNSSGGIALPQNAPFIALDWNAHRSLVQSAWYFVGSAGAIVTAITVAMPRNPNVSGFVGTYAEENHGVSDGGDWNYQSGPSGIFMATPLPADLAYRLKSISPGLWGGQ